MVGVIGIFLIFGENDGNIHPNNLEHHQKIEPNQTIPSWISA